MVILSETFEKWLITKFCEQCLTISYQQQKVEKDIMEFDHGDLIPMSEFDN